MPDGPKRGRLSQQDWDTVFAILSHPVRRAIVQHLQDVGSLDMDSLVDAVAEELGRTERETCIQLSHTHLPKLDSAGYLNYERGEDRVDSTEKLASLVEIIHHVNEVGEE